MDISTKVNDIYYKVEKILLLQNRLKEENLALNKENGKLKEEVKALKNQLNDVENQNKIVKLAKTLAEVPVGVQDAKTRVNELIKEVDKCIALLNR